MKELINKLGTINDRGIFTLNGRTHSFTINENPYSKTFKVDVTLNSALFIGIPITKYLHKTIHEVSEISNKKERIKLVDNREMANKFSSKEKAIEFVKEYIEQLREEYYEDEEISHKLTKEDLL